MGARLADLIPLRERIKRSLATDGSATGLELIARLAPGAPWWRRALDRANIYPTLHHLERLGELASHEGPPIPERGGRPRRVYRLRNE
jgi:PadR family transcriptional regulator PadR